MKIGLIDVDSFNRSHHSKKYPNLALMKLSAYHKARGDSVEFVNNSSSSYDLVYKSKVFTFGGDSPIELNAKEIKTGGTGYKDFTTLPDEIEHTCPDYSLYDVEEAYGFLTRGCIRKCPWCIVPQKEGKLRPHADIAEFLAGRKAAILMDNNVLASDWGLEQIEKIVKLKIRVDFNQGLDARLISSDHSIARLLSQVKWYKPLRMACDMKSEMGDVEEATRLLREYGTKPKNFFIYVLVKDIPDALERVLFLKRLGLDPYAQPFRDYENNKEPEKEAMHFRRWVNCKWYFKSCTWEEYRYHEKKLDKS
jgi:hypothetical protein